MSVINDEQILNKTLDYINIFNFDEITVIRRNQAVSYVQDRDEDSWWGDFAQSGGH